MSVKDAALHPNDVPAVVTAIVGPTIGILVDLIVGGFPLCGLIGLVLGGFLGGGLFLCNDSPFRRRATARAEDGAGAAGSGRGGGGGDAVAAVTGTARPSGSNDRLRSPSSCCLESSNRQLCVEVRLFSPRREPWDRTPLPIFRPRVPMSPSATWEHGGFLRSVAYPRLAPWAGFIPHQTPKDERRQTNSPSLGGRPTTAFGYERRRRREFRTTLVEENIIAAAASPGEMWPVAARGIAARL